jgi:D-lyxose ketol-isomerase
MNQNKINRRAACAGILGAGSGLLAAGSASAGPFRLRHSVAVPVTTAAQPTPALKNSDFYDAQGKFNEKAAKEAYLRLIEKSGLPMSDNLRKNLAVSDFSLGRFAEVGLGFMLWVDEKEADYASIEIVLLPNQMIPEHWHVAIDGENVKPKRESWIVRWGSTFTYAEGEPTAKLSVKIHDSEAKYVTVKHETALKVGEVTGIKKAEEKHWQQAGPQGAIITEVSTYHTGAAVRFTNPNIKF